MRGGRPWEQRGKSSKTFFFFFCGKRHDNKILKLQILLSRNFVVIAQAPNLNRTFPGAKKGGMKGEVKRGEVVRECTGPEGERGGRNEGKRVRGKGSESTLEKL